jgi:ubiquinone/menaquinone biosynthesis C-methylase UbiE
MGTPTGTEYVELKQSLYRQYSRSYDEDRKRFVGAEALAQRISWALEPLRLRQHLLDLGCGSGELLLSAVSRGEGKAVLVGLDLTPEMLTLARARVGPDVSLIIANVLDGLPFREGSFHLVTSLNLVQELPLAAITSLLAEVHRTLKPGGTFRAVIPCLVGDNPSSRAFRDMATHLGAMDFLFAEELEGLLTEVPLFDRKEFDLRPSPAASNAARGVTRFNFFTELLEKVRSMGLDPTQVRQGGLFFEARRGL